MRKKIFDHPRRRRAPPMKHHSRQCSIGKQRIDRSIELLDGTAVRRNPRFDLCRCQEKAFIVVADLRNIILKPR
jgi:hypothetical protein